MNIRLFTFVVLMITNSYLFSQQARNDTFGTPSHQELTITKYDNDPNASGLVLYEKGYNYFKYLSGYTYIYKEVHRKIKVLDTKNFDGSTIEIWLYGKGSDQEKLTTFKALTHNGEAKTYINDKDVYDLDTSGNWSSKRFTFPNVKNGSILEYSYTIRTPYLFNFGDWNFQGKYPKVYSDFKSEIPGNYVYNRAIFGKLDLIINEATVKRNCFSLPQFVKSADCEISHYVMEDIPAFKEEEYMLAKSNYISRIDYELKYYYNYNGEKTTFSKTWKDVDKEFKYDKDIGRQLKNNSFFKDKIPSSLLSMTNDLEKAKAIYSYIQNHFTWNGNNSVFEKARVKKAFEIKKGSSTEINLALINSLQAANLEANLVLHSTRENGLPALAFPVISDFNYVLVHLKIEEEEFLLDASDTYTPFGIVPFRALNLRGRVMDFKKESYWHTIKAHAKNVNYLSATLVLNDDKLSGQVSEISTGYDAIANRKKYTRATEEQYLVIKEERIPELAIFNFTAENTSNLEQPFKETYEIEYGLETIGGKIYLNPFFIQKELKENPFKSETRAFPINFGYPIANTYMVTIDLNNQYEIEELPKNKMIEFAGGVGVCKVIFANNNGNISLRFNFKVTESHFLVEDYVNLKEYFKQVAEVLNDTRIILKKI